MAVTTAFVQVGLLCATPSAVNETLIENPNKTIEIFEADYEGGRIGCHTSILDDDVADVLSVNMRWTDGLQAGIIGAIPFFVAALKNLVLGKKKIIKSKKDRLRYKAKRLENLHEKLKELDEGSEKYNLVKGDYDQVMKDREAIKLEEEDPRITRRSDLLSLWMRIRVLAASAFLLWQFISYCAMTSHYEGLSYVSDNRKYSDNRHFIFWFCFPFMQAFRPFMYDSVSVLFHMITEAQFLNDTPTDEEAGIMGVFLMLGILVYGLVWATACGTGVACFLVYVLTQPISLICTYFPTCGLALCIAAIPAMFGIDAYNHEEAKERAESKPAYEAYVRDQRAQGGVFRAEVEERNGRSTKKRDRDGEQENSGEDEQKAGDNDKGVESQGAPSVEGQEQISSDAPDSPTVLIRRQSSLKRQLSLDEKDWKKIEDDDFDGILSMMDAAFRLAVIFAATAVDGTVFVMVSHGVYWFNLINFYRTTWDIVLPELPWSVDIDLHKFFNVSIPGLRANASIMWCFVFLSKFADLLVEVILFHIFITEAELIAPVAAGAADAATGAADATAAAGGEADVEMPALQDVENLGPPLPADDLEDLGPPLDPDVQVGAAGAAATVSAASSAATVAPSPSPGEVKVGVEGDLEGAASAAVKPGTAKQVLQSADSIDTAGEVAAAVEDRSKKAARATTAAGGDGGDNVDADAVESAANTTVARAEDAASSQL